MTFLRFIQYVRKFMPNMAEISATLRKLPEKNTEWKWTEAEENSFNKLKKVATEAPVLRFYDLSLPLKLSVDSRLQVLVTFSCRKANQSIRLTRADQNPPNYAQIENETLAVVFGCEEFPQHVYGRTLEVETDHIPL